jgi:hypothetical protein
VSYARWGAEGSEVYVFAHSGGHFCCMGCRLLPADSEGYYDDDFTRATRTEMIAHLEAHRAVGHAVPESALERLHKEVAAGMDAWADQGDEGFLP